MRFAVRPRRRACAGPALAVLVLAAAAAGAGESAPPAGVQEIPVLEPAGISGVAASPGGFAVIGGGAADRGYLWPGGATFEIDPPVVARGLDFLYDARLQEVWLLLDRAGGRLVDRGGGELRLPEELRERCGRGPEGLAGRWVDPEIEVAVLWEGGAPGDGARGWRCRRSKAKHRRPRVAIFKWRPGEGIDGRLRLFELEAPEPAGGNVFRAADLVWYGDELLVLLSAAGDPEGGPGRTWLQAFDLEGRRVGEPLRLEEAWGPYHHGKRWEALDWTPDSLRLVMAYSTAGESELVLFEPPEPGRGPGLAARPEDKRPPAER